MSDRFYPVAPRDPADRADDGDTVEYQTEAPGAHKGQGASRASRGYWVDPDERALAPDGTARPAGAPRGVANQAAASGARQAGARQERARASLGRRVVRTVVPMMVFAVLIVLVGTTLVGQLVVPGLSAKIFPLHYQQQIAQVSAEYGQDPYLVAAMVKTESGFDANAKSQAGAVGLLQLMPNTAEWAAGKMGKWKGAAPVLTEPVDNLELGVWYMSYLGGLYGDGSVLALAAYNAGLGNVDQWIDAAGGRQSFSISDIPFAETRHYVQRVEHYLELYKRIYPHVFDSAPR